MRGEIPQALRDIIVATQNETRHVTFFYGNRKVFYRRFKPDDPTRALTWAEYYWRDDMRWAVAVDQPMINTNPPAPVTWADGCADGGRK